MEAFFEELLKNCGGTPLGIIQELFGGFQEELLVEFLNDFLHRLFDEFLEEILEDFYEDLLSYFWIGFLRLSMRKSRKNCPSGTICGILVVNVC